MLDSQNEMVNEVSGLRETMFLLKDNKNFFLTGFKVMQSIDETCFVRLIKLKYNGRVKLIYFTSHLKPLSDLRKSINEEKFMGLISCFLENVLKVKNNGFLNCQNLLVTPDKIFVHPDSLEVRLIYLPLINTVDNSKMAAFEKMLKGELSKMLKGVLKVNSQILECLEDNIYSIEDVYNMIQKNGINRSCETAEKQMLQPVLKLESLDGESKGSFYIRKESFIIGKRADQVDGLIDGNATVSRRHCQIIYKKNHYYITDLGSSNGTFVNDTKVINLLPLNDGDILRLANSKFKVNY